MLEEDSIREIIAFPKNKEARDVMLDTPSLIDNKQLKEVHIEVKKKASSTSKEVEKHKKK